MKKKIITIGFLLVATVNLFADSTSTAYKTGYSVGSAIGRNPLIVLIAALACIGSFAYLYSRRKAKQ